MLPIDENLRPDRRVGSKQIEPVLQQPRGPRAPSRSAGSRAELDALHANDLRARYSRDLDAGATTPRPRSRSCSCPTTSNEWATRSSTSGKRCSPPRSGSGSRSIEFRVLPVTSVEDSGGMPSKRTCHPSMLTVEALGETRSGCRIDRVAGRAKDEEDRMVVFKEGPAGQADRREGVHRPSGIERLPGYAPQIYSFQDRGRLRCHPVRIPAWAHLRGDGPAQRTPMSSPPAIERLQTCASRTSGVRTLADRSRSSPGLHRSSSGQRIDSRSTNSIPSFRHRRRQRRRSRGRALRFELIARACTPIDDVLFAPFSVHGPR